MPNTEKDLAGYIVLRGIAPAETLAADHAASRSRRRRSRTRVQPGVRVVYAVRAVDRAGNMSAAVGARRRNGALMRLAADDLTQSVM